MLRPNFMGTPDCSGASAWFSWATHGSCKTGSATRMCLRHVLLAVRHAHAVRLVICTHIAYLALVACVR
eukprot:4355704-Pyramimonas_sp.AAC.1